MRLPRWLTRHSIVVEPYVGRSGTGPVYGPPRTVRCHLDASRATSRGANARTTGDASTAYVPLDAAAYLTPEARVTVDGRVVEVVSVRRHEFPRSPVPEHLEVTFL